MCWKYIIVYYGCVGKKNKLPSCKPIRSQVREYVDSDGWHLCGKPSCNEVLSEVRAYTSSDSWHPDEGTGTKHREIRLDVCTFIEPYCSDACEKFHEATDAVDGNKDRLGYAEDEVVGGIFPVDADFGHLRVDSERVMLVYKSLIDLTNKLAQGIRTQIEFPIIESYPGRLLYLFLMSPKSQAGDNIMASFPTMAQEEKVQLLQRTMGPLFVAFYTDAAPRTFSCQSSKLFQARGTRDDEQWQTFAQNVDRLNLPTSPPKPVLEAQHELFSMVETWVQEAGDFEASQRGIKNSHLMRLEQEDEDLEEEIQRFIEPKTHEFLHSRASGRSDLVKNPPLFKGVDVDPTSPFPQVPSRHYNHRYS